MKQFMKFEEHPYFNKCIDGKRCRYYEFKKDDETASFKVYYEAGREIEWLFEIEQEEESKMFSYNYDTKVLKERCTWFYEIIKEAYVSLEKRDKLRKLFMKI